VFDSRVRHHPPTNPKDGRSTMTAAIIIGIVIGIVVVILKTIGENRRAPS